MKHLTRVLFFIFLKFGGIGLLVLGILDSSFLFAPLGNDLLIVALASREHSVPRMLYYAGMSTIGSVLGCVLVDLVFRKAGEKGLEKHLPAKRLEYIKKKVRKSAPWALTIASIAPPPFPFTPFIMATSALQYPLKKMLSIVGAARMVRFTGLGVLAFFFGRRILRWARSDVASIFMLVLIIVCVVGSVISVVGWIKRSRSAGAKSSAPHDAEPAPQEH